MRNHGVAASPYLLELIQASARREEEVSMELELLALETVKEIISLEAPNEGLARVAASLLAERLDESMASGIPEQEEVLILHIETLSTLGPLAAGFTERLASLVVSGSVRVCEAVTDALGLIVGSATAEELLRAKLNLRSERRRERKKREMAVGTPIAKLEFNKPIANTAPVAPVIVSVETTVAAPLEGEVLEIS